MIIYIKKAQHFAGPTKEIYRLKRGVESIIKNYLQNVTPAQTSV